MTNAQAPAGGAEPAAGAAGDGPALRERVRRAGLARGFARVGFCGAEPFEEAGARLEAWLDAGLGGELTYLSEGPRHQPTTLLPGAHSVVVVALPLGPEPVALRRGAAGPPAGAGVVAHYARGRDYHDVMREGLRLLGAELPALAGRAVAWRAVVDSAPLLEREAGRRAGIGFLARSTMLLAPGLGTRFVLGALLTDLELGADEPVEPRCGTCRACLDACPTGAFVGPHQLDARRCISYLTIELAGPIPVELRALMGQRVFGCDVCQDVCPFNAGAASRTVTPALEPRSALTVPDLERWLRLGSAEYRKLVRGSALRRVNRARLGRNAAVALGNGGRPAAFGPLVGALREHWSPLVRGHAAWALGRLAALGGTAPATAAAALSAARAAERDASVLDEIDGALDIARERP